MEITPVTPSLPTTSTQTNSVQKVIPGPYGDKIVQTNYVVTLYDNNGIITTTNTSNQINYII